MPTPILEILVPATPPRGLGEATLRQRRAAADTRAASPRNIPDGRGTASQAQRAIVSEKRGTAMAIITTADDHVSEGRQGYGEVIGSGSAGGLSPLAARVAPGDNSPHEVGGHGSGVWPGRPDQRPRAVASAPGGRTARDRCWTQCPHNTAIENGTSLFFVNFHDAPTRHTQDTARRFSNGPQEQRGRRLGQGDPLP